MRKVSARILLEKSIVCPTVEFRPEIFKRRVLFSPPVGKVLVRLLLEKGIICPSVGKVSASILLEKGIICPLVGMVLARVCWRRVLFVPLRKKDLLASPKVCRKSPMQHAKKLFN
jgi:hypothetical protein